jgi:CxxC motif-containing protein (DUF1111 family)
VIHHPGRYGVYGGAVLVWLSLVAVAGRAQAPLRPGDPLPGISAADFSLFRLGLDDFVEVETAEDGLGPAFNGTSCAICHSVPAIGGSGVVAEVRAARVLPDGTVSGLDGGEGTLMHLFSTPSHGCQPMLPPAATVVARRVPIPLFGAGLVEAVPDETLLALEDPDDRNRDGVSGRAARVRDLATGRERVGRFGWKAQHATLMAFGADAYRNEMGITNDLFPDEVAFGVDPAAMRLCDPQPDPEDIREPSTRRRGIDNFETFMQLLAPVERGPVDEGVRTGEQVFLAVGCASCHVPQLTTGDRAAVPQLQRRVVPLYSDLLLHDVGTGDGIPQAAAAPNEIRTPALWGLRHRRPLLHDGSAATPEGAIQRHGGEAELARRGFERLSPSDRGALLRFLESL